MTKRFRADDALQATGERGPEVVLASDYDADVERLRNMLERIDRQLAGYAQFSPAHELHRLTHHALYGVYPADTKASSDEPGQSK